MLALVRHDRRGLRDRIRRGHTDGRKCLCLSYEPVVAVQSPQTARLQDQRPFLTKPQVFFDRHCSLTVKSNVQALIAIRAFNVVAATGDSSNYYYSNLRECSAAEAVVWQTRTWRLRDGAAELLAVRLHRDRWAQVSLLWSCSTKIGCDSVHRLNYWVYLRSLN